VCLFLPGVGRFIGGIAPTLNMLGISQARTTDAAAPAFHREYMDDYSVPSSLNEFMVACRKNITLWREVQDAKTLLSFTEATRSFLDKLAETCAIFRASSTLVGDFVLHKLTMTFAMHPDLPVDLATVCIQDLRSMCADYNELLSTLPLTWNAGDVSMFVMGCPDVFVLMWGCLWKEVATKHSVTVVKRLMQSGLLEATINSSIAAGQMMPPLSVLMDRVAARDKQARQVTESERAPAARRGRSAGPANKKQRKAVSRTKAGPANQKRSQKQKRSVKTR
jgi:hypothetical protein